MRYIKFSLVILFLGLLGKVSAQITFFEGTFEEAVEKAKKEKKELFVDFYADWCQPCKLMASQVFTLPEVGEYFNKNFLSLKINVEALENKTIVQKYKVNVLPTLLFINGKGEVVRTINGTINSEALLHEAKVVCGEALSFEKLYEKIRKEKKNLDLCQELLLQAPAFIGTQEGYNREKWIVRIESLFDDYVKNKKLENMANEEDFSLLVMFHPKKAKNDFIFDGLVTNYEKYIEKIGKSGVDNYIIALFNNYIISLCRDGRSEYKQELERLNGDLNAVYGDIPFGKLSAFEAINLLSDGYYNLYRKNMDVFFEKMNRYFEGAGTALTVNNYTMPVEDLFTLYQGRLPESAYPQVIPWLERALTFSSITPQLKTRVLCILGDCYKEIKSQSKAKQCFNQAFIVSAEIDNEQMRLQLQKMIQSRLNSL
ncbi:thioredoxin domain-containing protein [Butyricimonas synergistica]|uniref:thioredoxin domain-containing protein n=1 Tax=Butyricimonas synergistica TaxID=544644 RepID=UPI00036CF480|nr:thioredoxin domain-containing protein [Butyricimonas synergistica]